ncbi:MAG: hypothetical protein KDD44_12890, partial [Bdellovibrionales bacterium]|nr:hypothetical protein [Bdellovibrionales bacterium]
MRRDDESRALALAETAGIRHLDTLSTSQLPQAVWGITMLQSGLVVVLVFLEVAFWGGDVSDQLVAKLYGLMYVLVGSLLLAIVRPRYVGVGLVLNTGIIAAALLVSEALNAESNIVRGALPVLFLAATTLRLPWQISYNIAVHWLLLTASFASKLIPFWNESRSFEDAAEMALAIYRSELLVIVVGLVGLTLLARLFSRHALLNLVQLSEAPEAIAHKQNAVTTLVRQAEIGLLAERIRQLIAGLFILGICSCFCSSILLFRMNISLWPVAAAGWLVFFGLWSALLYLERREGTNEQLWFGGAFIALVLFLWPSILLLYSDAPGRFWIYWPISLLVGLGAIPWSFVELVPLVAAVVVTGFEILQKLDLGLMAAALFGIALLLSLLLSAQGSRRIRENYL